MERWRCGVIERWRNEGLHFHSCSCACLCMCVQGECMCTGLSMCLHVCAVMCAYTRAHLCEQMSVCTSMRTCTCECDLRVSACPCVCVQMCMCVS